MARNRVIYQSEALYVSSGLNSTASGAHAQLERVQSANYNFSISRQDINQYGQLSRIDSIVLEPPTVGLDFTYYLTDGFNERALNFYVQRQTGYVVALTGSNGVVSGSFTGTLNIDGSPSGIPTSGSIASGFSGLLNSQGNLALKEGIDERWEVGGEYFQSLKNSIHQLNRRIHGNYASFDKTFIETYAIGAVVMFLKKYFIDMLTNRLGAEGSIKEYVSFNGRDYLNGNPRGYYYQTIQAHVNLARRGLDNWDLATPQEKQAVAKSLKEASVVLASLLLMGLMGYSGDDKNKKKN
jgi:hypothetical protein